METVTWRGNFERFVPAIGKRYIATRMSASSVREVGFGSKAPVRSAAGNGCNPAEAVDQSTLVNDN